MRQALIDILISDDEGDAKYSFFELDYYGRKIPIMIKSVVDERYMGAEPFVSAKLMKGTKDLVFTIFNTIIETMRDAKTRWEDNEEAERKIDSLEIKEEDYNKHLNSENFVSFCFQGNGVEMETNNKPWLYEVLSVEPEIEQFIRDIFEQKEISITIP